jgi:hypothetical protein
MLEGIPPPFQSGILINLTQREPKVFRFRYSSLSKDLPPNLSTLSDWKLMEFVAITTTQIRFSGHGSL